MLGRCAMSRVSGASWICWEDLACCVLAALWNLCVTAFVFKAGSAFSSPQTGALEITSDAWISLHSDVVMSLLFLRLHTSLLSYRWICC